MALRGNVLRPTASGATHPEAAAWARRVINNSGTVGSSTLSAVSKFCAAINAANIRDRFYRLNLFCGDGLTAALVPLYRAESPVASVRGNATDTNINFVSADYANTGASSGFKGNASNKHLVTGLPGNAMSANQAHLGFGLRAADTSAGASRTAIGVYDGSQRSFEVVSHAVSNRNHSACFTRFGTDSDNCGDAVGPSHGPLAAGDIVATWPNMYRNGTVTGVTATTSSDFTNNRPVTIFATGLGANSATVLSDCRISWYSIGLTMTAAQVLGFYNAIAAFNAALSRT
jgi:hypothetical protein